MTRLERRALVTRASLAAIAASDAAALAGAAFTSSFPGNPSGSRHASAVTAAGKAARPMLDAFLAWSGGHACPVVASAPVEMRGVPAFVEAHVGGHPVPNESSVAAGRAALAAASRVPGDGTLIVLLSGGASALLAVPAPGVTLDDKVAVSRHLLRAGAAIDELNCVRKHLSAIKGGQLAASTRGRTVTFALSDVNRPVQDDPATIGSGPTVVDPTSFAQAVAVLERTGAGWREVAPRATRRLLAGREGAVVETPKPGDARLANSAFVVVGNRHVAGRGAASVFRAEGIATVVREAPVDGEARRAAAPFLDEALSAAAGVRPFCFVATGETTVTVKGRGRGGRNQEFVLAVAQELASRGIEATVASAGTDGIDGPTDAAGAIGDETTVTRARALGRDVQATLDDNDSYTLTTALGDAIVTGPTGTNVGDLALVLLA